MLNAEPKPAGAPPTGLHFVRDEDPARLSDNRQDAAEVIFRRHDEATGALNRLSHESGDAPFGACGDRLFQVLHAEIDHLLGGQTGRRAKGVGIAHVFHIGIDHAAQTPGPLRRQAHR